MYEDAKAIIIMKSMAFENTLLASQVQGRPVVVEVVVIVVVVVVVVVVSI